MSITNYIYDGGTLTSGATVQGTTVPNTAKRRFPNGASVTNGTASPVLFSLYLVPNGASAGPSNILVSAYSLASSETYNCPELVSAGGLNAGGTLQALGDGLIFKYGAIDILNG